MNKALVIAVALAFGAACSAGKVSSIDTSNSEQPQIDGPLRFEVSDARSQPGILWALPSVSAANGKVTVQNTQYGSLCQFAVTGSVQQQGRKLDLHVGFSERLTACIADVRALSYKATITEPSGTYDVTVIHHHGSQADTLRKQTVTVP